MVRTRLDLRPLLHERMRSGIAHAHSIKARGGRGRDTSHFFGIDPDTTMPPRKKKAEDREIEGEC